MRPGQKTISVSFIKTGITAAAMAFLLMISAVQLAPAQTFSVIHTFTGGGDGGNPVAGLATKGTTFYGTTYFGGHDQGICAGTGCGTVFKLSLHNANWLLTRIYPFTNAGDGAGPNSRLAFGPDGTLYGTTFLGNNIFNLKPYPSVPVSANTSWSLTAIHQFGNLGDGSLPAGDLTFDEAGNIYGTTSQGGDWDLCGGVGCGSVYEVTPSDGGWTTNLLYEFTGQADGNYPFSGVTLDSSGNLYGTASQGYYSGQYQWGSVFQLTNSGSGWTENTLYNFQGTPDGAYPHAGVILDQSGNLYGAASGGGPNSAGSVFELTPSMGNWIFSLLYPFAGPGTTGPYGNLIMDGAGNLYGTTYADGAFGYGSVFELTPWDGGWTYTSLYDFTGGNDGANPIDGLVMDANGNLFGTTYAGGTTGSHCDPLFGNQCGVVFEITP